MLEEERVWGEDRIRGAGWGTAEGWGEVEVVDVIDPPNVNSGEEEEVDSELSE